MTQVGDASGCVWGFRLESWRRCLAQADKRATERSQIAEQRDQMLQVAPSRSRRLDRGVRPYDWGTPNSPICQGVHLFAPVRSDANPQPRPPPARLPVAAMSGDAARKRRAVSEARGPRMVIG